MWTNIEIPKYTSNLFRVDWIWTKSFKFCGGDCATSFYLENCIPVISNLIFFYASIYQVCIFSLAAFFPDERTTWLCCWEKQGQYLFLPLCERAVWWKWRPQYAVRESVATRVQAAQRKVINHHQDHVTRHKRVGHDSRASEGRYTEHRPISSTCKSQHLQKAAAALSAFDARCINVSQASFESPSTRSQLTAGKFPVDARTFGTLAVANCLNEIYVLHFTLIIYLKVVKWWW